MRVLALLLLPWLDFAQPPTTRLLNDINWQEFAEWVPGKSETVLIPTGTVEAHGVANNGG